jgi:hypothetical protein
MIPALKNARPSELRQIRIQLLQIKYLLAGILGLAVFGRTGNWMTDLGLLAIIGVAVHYVESVAMVFVNYGTFLAARKAAIARNEARMNDLASEVLSTSKTNVVSPE